MMIASTTHFLWWLLQYTFCLMIATATLFIWWWLLSLHIFVWWWLLTATRFIWHSLLQLHFSLFLQFLNVIFFAFEAVYLFVPSIWIIFAVVLWEGLLGGAAYVNTYYKTSIEVSGFLYWNYLASVLLHAACNYNFIYLLISSLSAMLILGASIILCSSSHATFCTAT